MEWRGGWRSLSCADSDGCFPPWQHICSRPKPASSRRIDGIRSIIDLIAHFQMAAFCSEWCRRCFPLVTVPGRSRRCPELLCPWAVPSHRDTSLLQLCTWPRAGSQRGNTAPNIPACGISPATSQWMKRKELVTYKAEGPTDVLLLI